MVDLKVTLAEEQENDLKRYFYEIALESFQLAKRDLGLDRDLVNRKGMQQWLDISPQFLDELISLGMPYTLIGTKKYFFSKQECRKFLIDYNKK
ncbi:hypothetical protein [Enterococcus sp.]|uniref:hypothetical protein n=1 Tax=Enterococcus sp. TaxID=35783 RepID=UPI002898C365|nr:hypothetical protein [Enterococcus sp.]